MEALRANLSTLSASIPPLSSTLTPSALALISPNLLALLHTTETPISQTLENEKTTTLHLLPLPPTRPPTALPLPPTPTPPTTLLPAPGLLAITSPTSLHILEIAPTPTSPRPLAAPLFRTRPGLRLLHAAWSPAAPGFFMTLTSDASLRLYDVLSPNLDVERWRLRVVAPSPPVAFAFGRGAAWHALAVYVLAEDGRVYVAAPVAPIGTRLPRQVWARMRDEAAAVVQRETRVPHAADRVVGDPFAVRDPFEGVQSTPRRLLDFSGGENGVEGEEGTGGEESWTLRQARMQVRFLEHVFTAGADSEMVATREFKPAPVLFQGPLYTEHDDLDEVEDGDAMTELPGSAKFCSLTMLNCGPGRPPVLVRATVGGELSVLIGLESVEAQWFLSGDDFASSGEALLDASEEYAECARAVAPLLLCFEHFSFGERVSLFPVRGNTDADEMYALTSNSVYSVRLSFISAITDAATLESTPKSSVSLLLSAANLGQEETSRKELQGLAPWYAKGQGPVAIVVSADGALHASDPLRWVTDLNRALPSNLLSTRPSSDTTWNSERPLTGSRAFACPESGKEVLELFHAIQMLQGETGGRVLPGTLGKAGSVESHSAVMAYLEKRLEALTGGPDGPGIGDNLKAMADVLNQWSDELCDRAEADGIAVEELQSVLANVEISGHSLRRKLGQIEGEKLSLEGRMRAVAAKIRQGSSQLSPAELERYARLKDKKKRVYSLKGRIAELASAIEARKREFQTTTVRSVMVSPARRSMRSPMSGNQRVNRWSASPSWRGRESPGWRSPQGEQVDLSRQEMKEIRMVLEKHSKEIEAATELSTKVWKKLSAV